jgi:hypothetical protein
MIATKATAADELRMSGKEFDRIMGQALRVKPEDAKMPKRRAKTKATTKKKNAK